MRPIKPGLTLALAGIAALLLSACGGGGGGGGSSSSGGTQNQSPVANAGTAQTVNSGVTVTLNGSASSDSDGSIASYTWTQTVGGAITLSSTTVAQPTFTAPTVVAATTLTFSLVVTDNRGAASAASPVNVTVNPVVNTAPTSNAGSSQTVGAGTLVTLNGSASSDSDGVLTSYAWTQTSGTPSVTLRTSSTVMPTFVAPTVGASTTLTFSLVVTDNAGATSTASTVNVTINPLAASNAVLNGRVTFARVGFLSGIPNPGLNYGSPTQQPARSVRVEAVASPSGVLLTSGSTDSDGNYSLVVPSNTNVAVRVVARMERGSTMSLPRWDVRVQDGTGGDTPYIYVDGSGFSSGTGVTRNVAIPSGISAGGTPSGTGRHSGPFAVLDTIYTAMQTILPAEPLADFPELYVDWGTQTDGTFFTTENGQHIALLANLTEDTDEFDQHVVAHEFGHYIEFNFSRADNIGGPHSLGEKLDPRVAFGEGFGYAFAAIVLNDSVARDSFVDNGASRSGSFNVETNPPATGSNAGCWCSESSVWSILYDIADSNPDANDTLALGFQPIWDVLVGTQRTTPAFTTLFSFVPALKAGQPASVAGINALVAAQNSVATSMEAFATTETNVPAGVPSNAVLPVFTSIALGGSTTLRTVDDAGHYNKLGNRRFIRFEVASTRNVTVSLTTSNTDADRDPDFLVWRNGDLVAAGVDAPQATETETFQATPGTYIIDAYDCANGCDTEQGVPGDYDLTVTVN